MIHKKINKTGGLTIPAKVRRDLNIQNGDGLEINVVDGGIMIQPYQPRCVFCETNENVVASIKEKYICNTCMDKIKIYKEKNNG